MSVIIRSSMSKPNEARALIRDIFRSEADLTPDFQNKELNIHLHYMTTQQGNKTVKLLIQELNDAEYTYPGTELKIRYFLG